LSGQNAFDSHKNNAYRLKTRILQILEECQITKINIIAHSKGGIEARYMISELGMNKQVASLTTIATPHRGSPLANSVIGFIEKWRIKTAVLSVLWLYARLLGDNKPHIYDAGVQLTPEYMNEFNKDVVDAEDVYYQSYGGCINATYPGFLTRKRYKLLYKYVGESDGVVPVESFKWANFRGIINSGDAIGVSHFEVMGLTQKSAFDVNEFYCTIVQELKEMGF